MRKILLKQCSVLFSIIKTISHFNCVSTSYLTKHKKNYDLAYIRKMEKTLIDNLVTIHSLCDFFLHVTNHSSKKKNYISVQIIVKGKFSINT